MEDKSAAQLGQEAMEAGDFIHALAYFQKAYQEKPSFHLNRRIVRMLMETGQYREGLEATEDWRENYLQSSKALPMYFQLLLQNQQFITAHKLLVGMKRTETLDESQQEVLKQQLETAENYAEQFDSISRNQKLAAFRQIAEYPVSQQFHLLKDLECLTLKEYERLAKQVLLNPQMNYFGRIRIVEELVQLKLKEEYAVLWFDETIKKFQPNQLASPEENPTYLEVLHELEAQLENQNPSLLLELKEETRLHFALLYPFAEEYVSNPKTWAKAYILDYTQADTGQTEDLLDAREKISVLQEFMLRQMMLD